MRISHDFLVLDLEATSNQETEDDRPVVQTNDYIIDVGAVLVSRDLRVLGSFSSLVRPGEPVTPFIEGLTGISQAMVDVAPGWDEVGILLEGWARDLVGGNLKRLRVAAWGTYFDVPLLRRCYHREGLQYRFSGTAFDVKTVAMVWAALAGHRTDKLGVAHVASLMGIQPTGAYHRALVDAEVEADVLVRALSDLRDGHFLPPPAEGQPHRYVRMA